MGKTIVDAGRPPLISWISNDYYWYNCRGANENLFRVAAEETIQDPKDIWQQIKNIFDI